MTNYVDANTAVKIKNSSCFCNLPGNIKKCFTASAGTTFSRLGLSKRGRQKVQKI